MSRRIVLLVISPAFGEHLFCGGRSLFATDQKWSLYSRAISKT